MKKKITISIICLIAIVGLASLGLYLYNSSNINSNKAQTQTQEKKVEPVAKNVTYNGKDGVTALELLKENAKVITSGTGENAFVTTINGYEANSKSEYWSFSIDGKTATVGAGSYVTKDGEIIEWKIDTF